MQETQFFREAGVTITNARFIVPAQTYAMSGITSVKMFREPPRLGFAVLMLVIGALLCLGSMRSHLGFAVFGALIAAGGIALVAAAKSKYHVLLKTASGEAQALTSPDQAFIRRVVEGLNASIVHRG
ncbi:MAG: hypothetical protein AMXMBFR59_39890 [Rhodanobacteraceae bacterium]